MKSHEITLYSLIKDDSERRFIPELEKYCKKVKVFHRPKKPWSIRNIFLSVFGPFPLLVIRNLSLEERADIAKELDDENYDVIHAETFYVMPHLGRTNVPTILVEQTIWHNVYKHHVMTKVPLVLRPFYLLDVLKVVYWERHYWQKADRLFSVSEEDMHEMKKIARRKKVGIIPNGVDSSYYSKKGVDKLDPPRILYGVTNFEWLQNQEATEVLINDVWPMIKSEFDVARIWIAGRKIPNWVKHRAESEDVEITEDIPDARDAYGGSYMMVAPIKGAGGTRLKILEAMAAGLPVVSTTVGVAGLNLKNGENVLIADTTEGLAKCALSLLNDKELAKNIGIKGKKHVEKYFDWKSIVKLHDPIYKDLVNKK